HVGGKMWRCGDWDNSLPALSLTHVVENRDVPLGLHDPTEAAEIRQRRRQTTFAQDAILWAVGAIDAAAPAPDDPLHDVGRRHFCTSRRWRAVLPACASEQLVLAHIRGLKEGECILS